MNGTEIDLRRAAIDLLETLVESADLKAIRLASERLLECITASQDLEEAEMDAKDRRTKP